MIKKEEEEGEEEEESEVKRKKKKNKKQGKEPSAVLQQISTLKRINKYAMHVHTKIRNEQNNQGAHDRKTYVRTRFPELTTTNLRFER